MNQRSQTRALICLIGLLVSLLLGGAVVARHRYLSRGVVTGFPEPVTDADVPTLGVNAALEQYQGDQLAWAVDLIAAGGFHWVRQVFPWREIEPVPGEYDWAPWDRVVAAVEARGLQLVAVLHTAPAWARSDGSTASSSRGVAEVPQAPHPSAPPADPAAFSAFATAFATRYGDRVDYYQIWDEPNLYDGWGSQNPDAAAYTALLCAAADAIRAADRSSLRQAQSIATRTAGPEARILLAGLAPTVETGPRNLPDHLYLRALYQVGAAPCFDIVAAKPYGFDTGPDDRRVDPKRLNFSRLLLLREEMEAHGDTGRAIWAVNWGWNALPDGWDGRPSIWGQTDERTQAERTMAAIERAQAEWPWMGAMILENFQPASILDPQSGHVPRTEDPRWGFALVARDGTPRPVYDAVEALPPGPPVATPGVYPASTRMATFVGYWKLDPPEASAMASGDMAVLLFEGTGVALTVARSPYLGYLYVTVDGQPANALPRDPQGRAYAPLYGTLGEAATIPLATGLPKGIHTVVVTVEVGGGGWWLIDWRVAWERDDAVYRGTLAGLGALALLSAVGALFSAPRRRWEALGRAVVAAHSRASAGAQVVLTAVATVLRVSAWRVRYERAAASLGLRLRPNGFGSLGDGVAIAATLAAATAFYCSSSSLPLTLISGLALAALILLRLDLGLALVAATAPFYLHPRPLLGKAFAMAEILTLLCTLSWGLRLLANWSSHGLPLAACRLQMRNSNLQSAITPLDKATLFFVAVAIASFFLAEHRHVALRELRVLILEPALFYLMLRTSRLDGRAIWRVVDFFVLGAVAVALIGLVQYGLGVNVITAEEGFRRLRSVYGSPNSVGLYLGRVLPVLVAVALFGRGRPRHVAYGLAIVPLGLAVLLSFSKGALILGVPLSLLALGVLAGGPWPWASLGALAVAIVAAIPLLRTPRFASLLDTRSGTTFFRLQLWRSSWMMFRDHPWLGVGPDNFLYHYRSRYILPAASQEPNISQAHNILLDYATRLGVAGLAVGVWLQIAFWRLALPLRHLADPDRRALALGLMASMVNFLAHGLVDASYFLIDLAFAFFLTLGVIEWLAVNSNCSYTAS